jgi:hypothetical protein
VRRPEFAESCRAVGLLQGEGERHGNIEVQVVQKVQVVQEVR